MPFQQTNQHTKHFLLNNFANIWRNIFMHFDIYEIWFWYKSIQQRLAEKKQTERESTWTIEIRNMMCACGFPVSCFWFSAVSIIRVNTHTSYTQATQIILGIIFTSFDFKSRSFPSAHSDGFLNYSRHDVTLNRSVWNLTRLIKCCLNRIPVILAIQLNASLRMKK